MRVVEKAAAVACVGAALLATASAPGQPAPEPKKGWESEASVGVTLTRGNSETLLGTVAVKSQRKWSRDEMLLGVAGGYGENTTKDAVDGTPEHNTTDQYIKGFGQ
jgi:hypothetical protein